MVRYAFRAFVADQFIIPTWSMAPTLVPGDRVVVNKLIMGARLYANSWDKMSWKAEYDGNMQTSPSAYFILSAVTKAVGLEVFGGEVRLYLDIYFGGWLGGYSIYVAGIVCLAELLIGVCCLMPKYRRYANMAALVTLTFFVYLTGDNYFNPSVIGQIESCGCFGELIHFTPLESFIKSCVLWGMALSCVVMGRKMMNNLAERLKAI